MLLGVLAGTKDYSLVVDTARFLLFIALPLGAGGILLKKHYDEKEGTKKQSQKMLRNAHEKEVLKFVRSRGGKVTIADLVAETSVNAEEAEQILNDLIVKQLVDMKMDESGRIVYEWIELDSAERNKVRESDFLKD